MDTFGTFPSVRLIGVLKIAQCLLTINIQRLICTVLKLHVVKEAIQSSSSLPFIRIPTLISVCKCKNIWRDTVPIMRTRERHLFFLLNDNRTVILSRQDFFPDRTSDGALFVVYSLSSYLKFGLIAILSQARPPRDPKLSFRSL